MTLTEVLSTLIHRVPLDGTNYHFKPMTAICEIGQLPFDFIADIDNVEHMQFIAARIGATALYQHHAQRSGLRQQHGNFACNSHTVDLAGKYFSEDAALLGFTFDAAYRSCNTHGLSGAP